MAFITGACQRIEALSQAVLHEQAVLDEADIALPHPVSGAAAPVGTNLMSVARACLDDMKAEEAVEIDLVGKTSIADAMIVASGRSQRHVGSIAEKLVQSLKEAGHNRVRIEGMPACDWVLIDAGDLIVHLFRPEVRGFYNLEKMWGADRPAETALDRVAG